MDYIVGGAIILLLLLLIGIGGTEMISIVGIVLLAAMGIVLFLMALFFLGAFFLFVTAKRTKGVFCRFEKGKRFERAVFAADGAEYKISFPAETFFRKRIYKAGSTTLFCCRFSQKPITFDRHSAVIIVFGFVFSAVGLAALYRFISIFFL